MLEWWVIENLISGSFSEVMIWAWCLLMISCTSVTINIRVMFSCIEQLKPSQDAQFHRGLVKPFCLDCHSIVMKWTIIVEWKSEKREQHKELTTYQAKVSYIGFTNSNKFSKQCNTLRHHFFLSIKMHDLHIDVQVPELLTIHITQFERDKLIPHPFESPVSLSSNSVINVKMILHKTKRV